MNDHVSPIITKVGSIYWGEICPRSDPDIAHMGYYLDPLKLTYSHNVPLGMGFGITFIFPCLFPIGISANIDPTLQCGNNFFYFNVNISKMRKNVWWYNFFFFFFFVFFIFAKPGVTKRLQKNLPSKKSMERGFNTDM